jgi:hypothetical protein
MPPDSRHRYAGLVTAWRRNDVRLTAAYLDKRIADRTWHNDSFRRIQRIEPCAIRPTHTYPYRTVCRTAINKKSGHDKQRQTEIKNQMIQ